MNIKDSLNIKWRYPLKSDNLNNTMKLNRFLGNIITASILVLMADTGIFLLFTFVFNVIMAFPEYYLAVRHGVKKWEEAKMADFINMGQFAPDFLRYKAAGKIIYAILFAFLIIFFIKKLYEIRMSFAENDINKGNTGTQRWTTLRELFEQYKKVDLFPGYRKIIFVPVNKREKIKDLIDTGMDYEDEGESCQIIDKINDEDGLPKEISIWKTNWFDGSGGQLVSRWKNHIFLDTSASNNLFIGTTRSGKGEMFVFQSIDIYSRARELKNRASMILFDPKLELYKSSKRTLERRGYKVRLINIDDPIHSAGYNPLALVVKHYKDGEPEKAQQAAKTYSFGIFNSGEGDMQEPIWKNTATDLFTCLIVAQVSDCLEMDNILNMQRRRAFKDKQEAFLRELGQEGRDEAAVVYSEYAGKRKKDEDLFLDERIEYIPDDAPYYDIHPNEKNINCFSVINFFKDLCVRASVAGDPKNPEKGAKKTETLLDDYFNSRNSLDYASSLYASIRSAGDRTKGSIYTNMQSALTIFSLNNIAQMTAENDIDIEEMIFGDQPVAVFLGIPSEDRSNHFLATTFVSQVYQYIFQLVKQRKGKTGRKLKFILDELGNMPVIDNFDGFVTVCLSIGVSFDIYLQAFNQLDDNYGKAAATIKENFANKIYIMATGKESSEEFSTLLGNKTVISLQRTGTRFSTNKTYMESEKERALLLPSELREFRQGECAICRSIKRDDLARADIKPHPILNEYQEHISPMAKLKLFRECRKKRKLHGAAINPEDNSQISFAAELKKYQTDYMRRKGTALLYRWQYMTQDFPNPGSIDFFDICDESRADIDYTKRVNDPAKVAERLKEYYSKTEGEKNEGSEGSLRNIYQYSLFYNKMASVCGNDFLEKLKIEEDGTVEAAIDKLKDADLNRMAEISTGEDLNRDFKNTLIALLRRNAA